MNNFYNSYFKVDTEKVVQNFYKVKEYIGPDTEIIPA